MRIYRIHVNIQLKIAAYMYIYIHICRIFAWGQDSSVGIANRYGLEGPGI